MLTREQIVEMLRTRLEPQPELVAAWLGGSDATGRADEFSDIDLMVIAAKGKAESAAKVIEDTILSISPIRIRYRLPMPTWHGFEQAFYQLENAPEYLMIDWLIVEDGQTHPWLEVERHGKPRVLFDKAGLIHEKHRNSGAIATAIEKKVAELGLKFRLFRHMPLKLVERNLPVDAAYFYQSLVLRPLVDLLRCAHCPDRYDYGFRYLKDDLPPTEYETIRRLSFFRGQEQIPPHVQEASVLFESTLKRWE